MSLPIKLLNESQGHIVTIELTNGTIYRGKLIENEDNMNIQLKNVVITDCSNAISRMDHIFIRGSQIKFVMVPDMLENAPMFKKGVKSRTMPPIRGPKRR